MDMKAASEMTEASGLTNDPEGRESSSRSGTAAEKASQEAVLRIADRLRRMTLAAPLSSLFVAFLAGVVIARRR